MRTARRPHCLMRVLTAAAAVCSLGVMTTQAASGVTGGESGACAHGHLYWTNLTSVGSAGIDGNDVNEALVSNAAPFVATGITVAGRHLYWGNAGPFPPATGTGTIERSNLSGTGVTPDFITGASLPVGVAVAGGYIYWGNNLTGETGRARLNGSQVNQDFIATAQPEGPDGVVVGHGYIFWANDFNIGRARLNGADVNQNFIAVPDGPSGVSALAVDSQHIYWTDETAGTIGRANLDGTDVNQSFITGGSFPQVGLVVGCRHIYWTNADSGTIGRANFNGSGVNQDFISVTNNDLTGLAIDPGK